MATQKRKHQGTHGHLGSSDTSSSPATNSTKKKSKMEGDADEPIVEEFAFEYVEAEEPIPIARFSNGIPRPDAELELEYLKKKEERRQRTRILNATSTTIEYASEKLLAAPSQRFGFCVFDDSSKKISVYDASVFEMKARVIGESNEETTKEAEETYDLAKTKLVDSFGGRKQKRTTNSNRKYQIDEEHLKPAEAAIMTKLEDAMLATSSSEDRELEEDAQRNLPPFNRNATRVELIYPIEGIISEAEFEANGGAAVFFMSLVAGDMSRWVDKGRTSKFMIERIEEMKQISNKNERKRHAIIIHFTLSLIRFRRILIGQMPWSKLRDYGKNVSEETWFRFRTMFTFDASDDLDPMIRMTPAGKKLATHYLLVLLFIVNFFRPIPLTAITEELNESATNAMTITRNVGCTIAGPRPRRETDKDERLVVLAVPLQLPSLTKNPRKS